VLLVEPQGLIVANNAGSFDFNLPWFSASEFTASDVTGATVTDTTFVIKVTSGQ
jgi:hypothetical protein